MLPLGGAQPGLVGPSHATASDWRPMYRLIVTAETRPTMPAEKWLGPQHPVAPKDGRRRRLVAMPPSDQVQVPSLG